MAEVKIGDILWEYDPVLNNVFKVVIKTEADAIMYNRIIGKFAFVDRSDAASKIK